MSARKIKFAIKSFKNKPSNATIMFFIIVGTVAGIVLDNLLLWLAIGVAVGIVLAYIVDSNKN